MAFVALLACWQCGRWLSLLIPLPSALLGLLLLLSLLFLLGRVPRPLQTVSQFLLLHLSLFFVPAAMGIFFFAQRLQQHLWVFLLVIVFTTVLSLGLTAWFSQYLRDKHQESGDE